MPSKAKVSKHIQKARNKLKKIIEQEKGNINEKALEEVRRSIHQWIKRHEEDRVDLKDKTVSLFDENKHPAAPNSAYVKKILEAISHPEKEGKEAT